jgi:hypothetical protein
MTEEGPVHEDDGRALLAAYLPAGEPPEPPVTGVVTRARAVRRRRRTVLASAASVAAVLVAAAAVGLGPDRAAGPPAGPGPAGTTARPTDHASRVAAAPTGPAPPSSCQQSNRSNDAGAKAWASWVRGKLAGRRPQAGPVDWIRMCEIDFGYGLVVPPHTQNHAEYVLPLAGGVRGSDNLTAATDRWERLPAQYRTPCRDDVITEHVVCRQRRLPDGSLLVQRDVYDILIQGSPGDPAAKRDKQAMRDATRIFPDGRTVTVGLGYNFMPAWKKSFDRHVLSLDQLAAIVTDPAALRYLPRP